MRYWPLFVRRCRLPLPMPVRLRRPRRAPPRTATGHRAPGSRARTRGARWTWSWTVPRRPHDHETVVGTSWTLDGNDTPTFHISPTAPVACSRGLPRGPPRHFACRLLPVVPLQGHAGQSVRAPPWEDPSEQGALGCAAPVRRARPPSPRPYLCRSGWGRRPRARPLAPVSLEGRAGSGPSRSSEGAHWRGLCAGQA